MTDFSNILLHWMCFMFQETNNNSKSFRWSSSAHSIQFPSPFRLVWWSNKSPINVPLPMKLLVQEFVPFSSLLLGPLITSSISLAFFLPPPPPSLPRFSTCRAADQYSELSSEIWIQSRCVLGLCCNCIWARIKILSPYPPISFSSSAGAIYLPVFMYRVHISPPWWIANKPRTRAHFDERFIQRNVLELLAGCRKNKSLPCTYVDLDLGAIHP